MLDATGAAAWAIDREYRLLDANLTFHAASAAIIDRPLRIGESVLEGKIAGTVAQVWRVHYDAAFDGETGEFLGELPTPEGTRLLELHTSPLRNPDTREVIGCVAVCRDLTGGTPAERELQARASLDLELFVRHPQPMWIYDDESLQFLAVNDAAVAHYGWSEAEFLRLTLLDIRPPGELPAFVEHVAGQTVPRPPSREHWTHRRRDGRIFPVQIYASSIHFRGRPARVVSVHALDAVDSAFAWSHQSLHDAVIAMPIGVLVVSGGGVVQWSNPSAGALVGVPVDAVAFESLLSNAHPADEFAARARWRGYLAGDGALGAPFDVRFVHPDGHVAWVKMRAVPMSDAPG
ncbi:MAG: PAS domain-containing protein, partial [Gemmatimonadaceae bacterium]|nr:PAS domain-containing protein [Gemmatimonadaceae bacterium]